MKAVVREGGKCKNVVGLEGRLNWTSESYLIGGSAKKSWFVEGNAVSVNHIAVREEDRN